MDSPEISNGIHKAQPNGDADSHNRPRTSLKPDRLALFVLGGLRCRRDRSVEHPGEHGTEKGAVGQVNCEADLAEPEEDTGGKKLPESWGDEDGNDAGIHAEGRIAFWQEAAWWEDAVDLVQLGGPANGLGLVGRV